MSASDFLDRVFSNLPAAGASFDYRAWRHTGKPTQEGVGVLPASCDVEAMVRVITDIPSYKGNIDYVVESRFDPGPEHSPPQSVRFYQRIKIPVLGSIHMVLVLTDRGERDGWRVLDWHQLDDATTSLNPKQGARSDYNVGAWLLRPDAVGYALSSAPRKGDVGRLKFAALTKGADAGAASVLKNNIEGMLRFSRR